jgi:hypothetical protein
MSTERGRCVAGFGYSARNSFATCSTVLLPRRTITSPPRLAGAPPGEASGSAAACSMIAISSPCSERWLRWARRRSLCAIASGTPLIE